MYKLYGQLILGIVGCILCVVGIVSAGILRKASNTPLPKFPGGPPPPSLCSIVSPATEVFTPYSKVEGDVSGRGISVKPLVFTSPKYFTDLKAPLLQLIEQEKFTPEEFGGWVSKAVWTQLSIDPKETLKFFKPLEAEEEYLVVVKVEDGSGDYLRIKPDYSIEFKGERWKIEKPKVKEEEDPQQ